MSDKELVLRTSLIQPAVRLPFRACVISLSMCSAMSDGTEAVARAASSARDRFACCVGTPLVSPRKYSQSSPFDGESSHSARYAVALGFDHRPKIRLINMANIAFLGLAKPVAGWTEVFLDASLGFI